MPRKRCFVHSPAMYAAAPFQRRTEEQRKNGRRNDEREKESRTLQCVRVHVMAHDVG
jgi:hypothetical protein